MHRSWQHAKTVTGLVAFRARRIPGGVDRAGTTHDADDVRQLRDLAVLDRVANEFSLGRGAALHRQQQGQGRLAFAQVVADVLAQLVGRPLVVQQIVDQLECRAEGAAIPGACFLDLFGRRVGRGARWLRTISRS